MTGNHENSGTLLTFRVIKPQKQCWSLHKIEKFLNICKKWHRNDNRTKLEIHVQAKPLAFSLILFRLKILLV